MTAQINEHGGAIYGKRMTNASRMQTVDHQQYLLCLMMRKFTESAIDYQYGIQMTLGVDEFAPAMRACGKLPYLSFYRIAELI